MPRKHRDNSVRRSPSPKRQRYNSREDYREKRERKYQSPPLNRTKKYSSPVRKSSGRNSRYYSDSESDETSSESDSEETDSSDSETSSSESEYTSSSSESEDERSSYRRPSKNSNHRERKEKGERKRDKRENKDEEESFQETERRSSIENEPSNRHKSENVRNSKKTHKSESTMSVQNEDDESQEFSAENGKKYNGPPRFLVVSVDGQVLGQKKIYTSNTGPKNAAQKAFNRLCGEMNKKMEITVKKLDDSKGKEMTYFFKKEELNPPIEREIGGRKVVYRHKTVSC